jgi:hypothetical protein
MRAPDGSYLITGRPRSRTAWLAALFYAEVPCIHDDVPALDGLCAAGKPFGFSSPSLPAVDPKKAIDVFGLCPIVVIERDAESSHEALARWVKLPMPHWRLIEENYQAFLRQLPHVPLRVPYESLDDFGVVNEVHRSCTGKPLDRQRFEFFNVLRVDQHLEKIAAKTPAAAVYYRKG